MWERRPRWHTNNDYPPPPRRVSGSGARRTDNASYAAMIGSACGRMEKAAIMRKNSAGGSLSRGLSGVFGYFCHHGKSTPPRRVKSPGGGRIPAPVRELVRDDGTKIRSDSRRVDTPRTLIPPRSTALVVCPRKNTFFKYRINQSGRGACRFEVIRFR